MAIKALLLSAGLGTRLRPYTLTLPKPCIPFWGLPMMYYSLYLVKKAGVDKIAINLHHLPEKIKELTTAKNLSGFDFKFSLEKEKAFGSGGALYYAQKNLQDCAHFFAINSDEVMIPTTSDILLRLQKHHEHEGALATLLVTDHPELLKTLKPVWINQQGVVRAFGEKPEGSTEVLRPVHYTGYKIFNKDVLALIPEGESHIFHDVLVPAMKRGAKVCTLHDNGAWWETGNVKSLMKAVGDVIASPAHQKYMADVYNEFQIPYAIETKIHGDFQLAKDKNISVEGLTLKDVVFLDRGCHIKPSSVLQNVIVGKNASVGSMHDQMLLPGETQ